MSASTWFSFLTTLLQRLHLAAEASEVRVLPLHRLLKVEQPVEADAGPQARPPTPETTAPAGDNATREPQTPPEFRGGLGESGLASLKAFTEGGGTIITLNKASEVYTEKDGGRIVNALDSVDRRAFFIPGSILQVAVDPTNPIAFGSTPTVPIFYENGPTFKVNGDARSVAYFNSDKPLLSGWILGGQFLRGTSVIAEETVGKGRIILFGFRPQYRAQSEVTYKFLFNALLYSTSKPASIGTSTAGLPNSAIDHKGAE